MILGELGDVDSPEEDEFLLIFQLKLGGGNCSHTQPLIPDSDGSEKDDFDSAVIMAIRGVVFSNGGYKIRKIFA